jgi:crotonobetainyl-CoA:carnitine CoA-transferase CaiB-like acyl-CoA transferase
MTGPLTGVRVIELAQFWFAPSGTAVLADWGADVVKIEHPVHGDGQRGVTTGGRAGFETGTTFNVMWEQPNRGKRSVGIDVATDAGHEVLLALVATADVFMTNFLPDARQRLRIEPDDLQAVNPGLVYVRALGHGDRGPDRAIGGYDGASFWARCGAADRLMPTEDFAHPIVSRPAFGDGIGGLAVALAITGGLLTRERTGRAPLVDTSLLASGMWALSPDIVAAGATGDAGGFPRFNRDTLVNPLVNFYRTRDGRWLWLNVLQADRFWADLCTRLDRADLIDDPRFVTMDVRNRNGAACQGELDRAFGEHDLATWQQRLQSFEGVWSPVQKPGDLYRDAQVEANGYVQSVAYDEGTQRLVANPVQFDEQPPELAPAPELGQHTEEVLLELGMSWDRLSELKELGAIT